MDNLVNIAIIGTGQAATTQFTTGLPTDALLEPLSADSPEHQLLLAAGCASVYRRAGYIPAFLPAPIPAAEPEKQAYCSAKTELHLANILSERSTWFLLETLQLMQQAHRLLPSKLLPRALSIGKSYTDYRSHLYPLLGKRGLWLSQFQAEWIWVDHYQKLENAIISQDIESIWQEGNLEQRTEVLNHLRNLNPELARNWLVKTWQHEPAQTRKTLVSVLAKNLSLADEDFLELALDDRSTDVQKHAAILLAQLSDSAFSQRMQNRASTLLSYQDQRLKIALPETSDTFWQHDGLGWNLPTSLQTSAHWIIHILQSVPLTFWETHFKRTPEQLVDTLKNSAEDQIVRIGWCKAAQHNPNSSWLLPLWHSWHQNGRHKTADQWAFSSLYLLQEEIHLPSLLQNASQPEAENLMIYTIEHEKDWQHLLENLPKPWSLTFSSFFLQKFTEHLQATKDIHQYQDPWYNTLLEAASAIHPKSFNLALDTCQPLSEPAKATNKSSQTHWNSQIDHFRTSIQMRQQIREDLKG